ncbi:hypothetical protein T4B_14673 [Trichinella pseudospiralis]|uniref:Uncharacterized protein n=1 Tax=Trichinella pseudospiralis TaxID=6337 RepID=A0A0V1EJL2_TRIPS|nr:hypothetical protein T4A_6523 [Trichinella pseudospiralis]KRZ17961.1 hypothetical protein T4B_14673 [Trichinella pseudospiralis]KRZ37550.1 hypothetical protein T4C_6036 [Trichinella pseudospiralis]
MVYGSTDSAIPDASTSSDMSGNVQTSAFEANTCQNSVRTTQNLKATNIRGNWTYTFRQNVHTADKCSPLAGYIHILNILEFEFIQSG